MSPTAAHLLPRRAVLAALAAAPWAPWAGAARAAEAAPAAIEIESGVYMLPGARGQPTPENRGRIGNSGFIVGSRGVMAIDAGISLRQGEALLAAIAEVTPKPVKLLVLTHARQEFLFGAAAFQARGIPVQMQRQTAGLMASRCEGCLKTLRRELGEDEMRGTAVPRPDVLFDETTVIETLGRPVLLQTQGHSSGPGDIAVLDVRTRSLFGGGLLDQGRIPDIQDSRLDGWHLALAGLRTLRPEVIVPGHGAASAPELIDTVERYLLRLERREAALLTSGTALSEVPDASELAEYRGWDQYDTIHRRNASILFLRLEREQLVGAKGGQP
ncbi:MBL fold metallo-hydrolase [Rubrivivax sp. A210]|uniref:MBL fold metallo-hydrolase n=1 Tax=Rubrivivax sp. A210 TaxID=2772301 RepID=UPI00191A5CCA|nr:MBL fold metallo-hydrolase [Rubrivivax sp. A210]CAD5372148.1 MBL fold metallo-hydrolase [Rubrivivax sp. A210]